MQTEITLTALDDKNGTSAGIVCVLRNITDEKALLEAVTRYRYIVSASRDPMYFVDDSYTYLVANDAAAKWHARSVDEIIGRTVVEIHGSDKFDNIIKPMLDRCFAGESVEYQSILEYSGHGSCEAAVRYDPCLDDFGRVIGAAVSVRDVSQYQNPEENDPGKERVVVPMKVPRR